MFGVNFEQTCHGLTTLSRPNARGIPFFMLRIDPAGNVSKRFASVSFFFLRYSGACHAGSSTRVSPAGSSAPTQPTPLGAPQNHPSTTGASTAVTTALSPMAMPAKVPATLSTVKARAVPMPWAARPAAKPRAA